MQNYSYNRERTSLFQFGHLIPFVLGCLLNSCCFQDNMLYGQDKDKLRGYNEVTDEKTYSNKINLDPAISSPKQCSAAALHTMGNRLLDWFSVVMADSSKRRQPRSKSRGKTGCTFSTCLDPLHYSSSFHTELPE